MFIKIDLFEDNLRGGDEVLRSGRAPGLSGNSRRGSRQKVRRN
jgi:hypothetical protein